MPELPEVEIICRGLTEKVLHRRIAQVEVHDDRVLTGFRPDGRARRQVSVDRFCQSLTGSVIKEVSRRGKYLLLALSSEKTLLCHLRMTGQLILGPPRVDARIQFGFDGLPEVLNFCDTRRFGEMRLLSGPETTKCLESLGPEPLQNGWNVVEWGKTLRQSKAKVHAALLDQKRLAGLGNIYVTEALHLSGIRPHRRCHRLKPAEIPPLVKNIRHVLHLGLERRGVTFRNYRDVAGEKGRAQDILLAYGRASLPCRQCGTLLLSTKVNGRGTVYCPQCQK